MVNRIDRQTRQELKELLAELGPDTPLLLFSNLTVIVLAMVQGWSITSLLWVYWWQSSIIGFFNWRRIKQLKKFSTDGLKVNGNRVDATIKTKKDTAWFFLLHYGCFQFFYLTFILSLTKEIEPDILLSSVVGIAMFFFNHLFSFRYNLKKDLASIPNIGTLMFFPYFRVIPMHLIIFIGLWFGQGSRTELFFFLLLKTGVDLVMHVIQHVNWKEDKQNDKVSVEKQGKKKRSPLKARLKLWFFLGWAVFLALIAIITLAIK